MKRRLKIKLFLKTFVISAFLMALPMAATIFTVNAETQPIGIFAEDVVIERGVEPITIMMALTEEEAVNSFVLMQIDVVQSKIILSVLPPKLLLAEGDEFLTLSTVWEERGGLSTIRLMSDMLSIPIDRFANITEESLVDIVDMIGTVDMVIESEMLENISDELIVEGRQLLDGRRLAFLSNSGNTDFMLQFISKLLTQHSEKISAKAMNTIFNTVANTGKNNLSITDYKARENIKFRIRDDFVTSIAIKGEATEDGSAFILHPQSLEDITKGYNYTNSR